MPTYHLTLKSNNSKTGPIPVGTTSRDTCPVNCAMKTECYAASGPISINWAAVSNGSRGTNLDGFCSSISSLPDNQLWRHNQAGDLPGDGRTVDPVALGAIVWANIGRRGFTYTHYRDAESLKWVRHANNWGFRVNLSANDLEDADMLADTGAGPVVVVLPSHQTKNTFTPAGRAVVVCPAAIREDVSCATCQMCQRERSFIVGFPAHGAKRKVIDIKLAA